MSKVLPYKRQIMKKVLIVDDEVDVQELLKVTLEFGDYEVMLAGGGQETLELAHTAHPDVIVLDIVLPYDEINGVEICRRLKADPATAYIKIILLSGRAKPRDIEAGMAAGADDYMAKPFSPLGLIGKIERAIQEPPHEPSSETSPEKSRSRLIINPPPVPLTRPPRLQ
jgi:CheY-like chemotaxis protein